MVVVTDEFANDPHMPMRAYRMNHVLYCIHDGRLRLKIVQDDVSAWIDFMALEKLTGILMSETSIRFQGVFLGTLIYKLFAPVSWLQRQQDMLIVPIRWITQRVADVVRLSVGYEPRVFPGRLRVSDLLTGCIVLESRELLDALLLKEDQVVSLAVRSEGDALLLKED